LGGFYNKEFLGDITKSFGLGPLPAWAAMAMYLVLAGTTGMVRS
jgi:hypothetical protein